MSKIFPRKETLILWDSLSLYRKQFVILLDLWRLKLPNLCWIFNTNLLEDAISFFYWINH